MVRELIPTVEFMKNKKEGYGVLRHATGTVEEGMWINGELQQQQPQLQQQEAFVI